MQGSQAGRAGRLSIRVHFNQLALFLDQPLESKPETAAEVADDGTNSARRSYPEILAAELPADGVGPGEAESPGAGTLRGAGEIGRSAVRTGIGPEDGLSGSMGNSGV